MKTILLLHRPMHRPIIRECCYAGGFTVICSVIYFAILFIGCTKPIGV